MNKNILRKFVVILLASAFLFTMTACGKDPGGNDPVNPPVDNPIVDPGNDSEEIKEPVLQFWHVYNPNGIMTLCLGVKNQNKFDIDLEMTVTYYYQKEKVGESTGLYRNALTAGEEGVIWFNWEIPKEVDDIKIEYTYLEKSLYTAAKTTVTKEETTADGVLLDFNVKGDCNSGIVYVLFYYENEFVTCISQSFFDFANLAYEYKPHKQFTSYKVYTNFY